jgi:hypothetical protein
MGESPRKRHLGAEQRRALQFLASSLFGVSEAIMFAQDFKRRMLASLIRAGLATAQRENIKASLAVGRIRITDAGRRALEGWPSVDRRISYERAMNDDVTPSKASHQGGTASLQLLARSPFGAAEATMLTNGFTRGTLAGLVRAGIAMTHSETVKTDRRLIGRIRITEADRRVIEDWSSAERITCANRPLSEPFGSGTPPLRPTLAGHGGDRQHACDEQGHGREPDKKGLPVKWH